MRPISSTGGALLRNIAPLIESETGMPVRVANNPMDCVVIGISRRLESNPDFDSYMEKRSKRYR